MQQELLATSETNKVRKPTSLLAFSCLSPPLPLLPRRLRGRRRLLLALWSPPPSCHSLHHVSRRRASLGEALVRLRFSQNGREDPLYYRQYSGASARLLREGGRRARSPPRQRLLLHLLHLPSCTSALARGALRLGAVRRARSLFTRRLQVHCGDAGRPRRGWGGVAWRGVAWHHSALSTRRAWTRGRWRCCCGGTAARGGGARGAPPAGRVAARCTRRARRTRTRARGWRRGRR